MSLPIYISNERIKFNIERNDTFCLLTLFCYLFVSSSDSVDVNRLTIIKIVSNPLYFLIFPFIHSPLKI